MVLHRYCARYVRQALEAGGMSTDGRPALLVIMILGYKVKVLE